MPATGRYAVQGAQVRAGLELWASRAGTRLVVEDDRSRPARAARLHAELVERGCQFVRGPYGSDSARAVAAARTGAVVWEPRRGSGRRPAPPWRGLSAVPGQPLPGRARSGGRRAPASRHDRPRDRDRSLRPFRSGRARAGRSSAWPRHPRVLLLPRPASRRRRRRGGRDPGLRAGRGRSRAVPRPRPPSPQHASGRRLARPRRLSCPAGRRSGGPARARAMAPGDPHVAGARAKLGGADRRRPRERARRARRPSSAPSSSIPLPASSGATAFRSCAGAERAKNSCSPMPAERGAHLLSPPAAGFGPVAHVRHAAEAVGDPVLTAMAHQ